MTKPPERSSPSADDLAREVLSALSNHRQMSPLTTRFPGLDLSLAYRVTAAVRRLRGERGEHVVGRKIGFTNRTIWDEYDVHAPIWGYVYDSTVHRLADLGGALAIAHLVEPRIEPEIVFRLSQPPSPGMDDRALLGCVEWVAHGFEVVQSLFPGWCFQAADTVAAFGLHGALAIGEPQPVSEYNVDFWLARLATFETILMCNGAEMDRGHAGNVLGGGPVTALSHLVEALASDPDSLPLATGELVSTGTLTRALPVLSAETWTTRLVGLPLQGISLALAP